MRITVCFEQSNCYKYFINKYFHGGSQSTNQRPSNFGTVALDILTDCTVNDTEVIFYPQPVPPPLFATAPFPHNTVPANLLNKLIHKL